MSKRLNNTKEYTINPSELSYKCDHCAHLKHNYGLEDRGISAGITTAQAYSITAFLV